MLKNKFIKKMEHLKKPSTPLDAVLQTKEMAIKKKSLVELTESKGQLIFQNDLITTSLSQNSFHKKKPNIRDSNAKIGFKNKIERLDRSACTIQQHWRLYQMRKHRNPSFSISHKIPSSHVRILSSRHMDDEEPVCIKASARESLENLTGSGSMQIREVSGMNNTSKTIIRLIDDPYLYNLNNVNYSRDIDSVASENGADIVTRFHNFAEKQVETWGKMLQKIEKATDEADGHKSIIDKCIDFKRRGLMSIKILKESLERVDQNNKSRDSQSNDKGYLYINPKTSEGPHPTKRKASTPKAQKCIAKHIQVDLIPSPRDLQPITPSDDYLKRSRRSSEDFHSKWNERHPRVMTANKRTSTSSNEQKGSSNKAESLPQSISNSRVFLDNEEELLRKVDVILDSNEIAATWRRRKMAEPNIQNNAKLSLEHRKSEDTSIRLKQEIEDVKSLAEQFNSIKGSYIDDIVRLEEDNTLEQRGSLDSTQNEFDKTIILLDEEERVERPDTKTEDNISKIEREREIVNFLSLEKPHLTKEEVDECEMPPSTENSSYKKRKKILSIDIEEVAIFERDSPEFPHNLQCTSPPLHLPSLHLHTSSSKFPCSPPQGDACVGSVPSRGSVISELTSSVLSAVISDFLSSPFAGLLLSECAGVGCGGPPLLSYIAKIFAKINGSVSLQKDIFNRLGTPIGPSELQKMMLNSCVLAPEDVRDVALISYEPVVDVRVYIQVEEEMRAGEYEQRRMGIAEMEREHIAHKLVFDALNEKLDQMRVCSAKKKITPQRCAECLEYAKEAVLGWAELRNGILPEKEADIIERGDLESLEDMRENELRNMLFEWVIENELKWNDIEDEEIEVKMIIDQLVFTQLFDETCQDLENIRQKSK